MKGIFVGFIFLLSLTAVLAYTNVVDLGTIPSHSPSSLSIELPADFRMVEVANYEASNPDQVAKYMGWNGMLKVNDNLVWNVKSTTPNGVFVMDRTIGQVVDATSGINSWLDATNFFKAGKNTLSFYHENQGNIGVKVRITVVTAEEAKQDSKAKWGFGFNVQKPAGGRCDTNGECKSAHCERHVCCEDGKECCSSDGECASFVCDDHYYYCVDKSGAPVPQVQKPSVETVQALVPASIGCNGCTQGDSCLPFHERMQIDGLARYCAVSGKWTLQVADGGNCQNAYECTSNQCTQGSCGVPGVVKEESGWDKFVAWLKSIFS